MVATRTEKTDPTWLRTKDNNIDDDDVDDKGYDDYDKELGTRDKLLDSDNPCTQNWPLSG